jgi:Arc/MetJ family transcription regulator
MCIARTNIDIDDRLLAQAATIAGTRTKRSTVEFALSEVIRVHAELSPGAPERTHPA